MFSPLISPAAKLDIKNAAKWYNSQQKGLGKRFTQQVRKKVTFLCQNPKGAPIRYKEVRTAVIDIFPFMIHYKVDNENKKIIIIAVFNTSLNPESWNKRS